MNNLAVETGVDNKTIAAWISIKPGISQIETRNPKHLSASAPSGQEHETNFLHYALSSKPHAIPKPRRG